MCISSGQTEIDLPAICHVASNYPVRRILLLKSSSSMLTVFLRKLVVDEQHQMKDIQELYNKVNQLTNDQTQRRLFAVIQLGNEQRKVTTEDIICKVDDFHPTIGDRSISHRIAFVPTIDHFVLLRFFSSAVQISPSLDDHFSVHTLFVSKA
jgi:hypothetical protein